MRNRRSRQHGMSLVEIMVGVAIGIAASIVMMQVFAASDGWKRTTAGGSDAQVAGAAALFTIERDARQAGFGINSTAFLDCTVHAYDEGTTPAREFTLKLLPIEITQGAGGAPDMLTMMYGNSELQSAPVTLTGAYSGHAASFHVDSRYGINDGDLVIIVQPGRDCSMRQITESHPNGQPDVINHANGNYRDPHTLQQQPARYNKAAGMGIAYDASQAKLYNIGPAPINVSYWIQGGALRTRSTIAGSGDTLLVERIVDLQAQYGKDDGVNNGTVAGSPYAADDGIVDRWDDASPATPADWARVLSVRVAVAAASAQPEKRNAAGQCTATASRPTWPGGTLLQTATGDWRCWRYKVFQTTVPLRNMIWRPAA